MNAVMSRADKIRLYGNKGLPLNEARKVWKTLLAEGAYRLDVGLALGRERWSFVPKGGRVIVSVTESSVGVSAPCYGITGSGGSFSVSGPAAPRLKRIRIYLR